VTADRRAEEQSEMLRRRGARVLHGPAIRTLPLGPEYGLRRATEALVDSPPHVVIANTGIGIRSWFAAAESWGLGEDLSRAFAGARILARGPKAAGAVLTAGLPVAWRAPSETLTELVEQLLHESLAGSRVALQLDGNSEQRQSDRLRRAGAEVIDVPVYRWTLPPDRRPALRVVEAACAGRLDAVTFTSAAALDNLFVLADRGDQRSLLRDALNNRVLAMCVGPVCAQVAADHGVHGIEPDRPRLGSMVHSLTEHLAARRRHVRMGGVEVVVQGALVKINRRRVTLRERERAVFDVLLRSPGAVVSRGDLLREVWGTATADKHALEVTVARLRKRLGAAGDAVRTVIRRGYRLDVEVA
jgi:uroporphyrinogen-III synthase